MCGKLMYNEYGEIRCDNPKGHIGDCDFGSLPVRSSPNYLTPLEIIEHDERTEAIRRFYATDEAREECNRFFVGVFWGVILGLCGWQMILWAAGWRHFLWEPLWRAIVR